MLGNVGDTSPQWSTENEWVRAYESHGIEVLTFREEWEPGWRKLIDLVRSADAPDWIHWISTPPWRIRLGHDLMNDLRSAAHGHVPIVATHLDRFWNIQEREQWIRSGDPYFKIDLFCTADGGNEERWEQAGVNHRWMLPGVGEQYCHRGTVREEFEADIVFVGSWRQYHKEARHRRELLSWLRRTYGPAVEFWPRKRKEAVRGDDLTDLYWSAKVAVGDSYFESRSGSRRPPPNYSSDRVSESLGRGAMLFHPEVPGITDGPFDVPNLTTYPAWGWGNLQRSIDESLELTDSARTRKRNAGIKHIKAHHTYEVRVSELVMMMVEEGLL